MKKPYCCDASHELYKQYYDKQQRGDGDFPVYVGAYKQRGHGLGNILRSLWRRIVPAIKTFGPRFLRAGANIVEDVVGGKSWHESAFKRIPEAVNIKNPAPDVSAQSGSGRRRKRIKFDILS